MFGDFFASIGMLLVMAGIIVCAWWASRVLGKRFGPSASGKEIKIIERVSIGPERSLFLVEYKEHTYLLSSSPAGIQCIDKMERESSQTEEGCGNG